MSDESIFTEALAIRDPARRAVYLDQACGGNPNLRRDVEALLVAHVQDNPLDRASPQGPQLAATYLTDASATGTIVAGRYKLLEQIGEGGMGTVWVAEQTEPVRRKVALKLIKAGMDSKAVLARFEAERQALAMMDHPNIARVLDGGLTDTGRPYFVMEYVKGVPITEYCDTVKLNIPQRLELFVQVCAAVQHAHQKGIIHRDLKPSNILVAPYDDQPVPKVIDFGLAKALHQRLTDRTLHTAHETIIGTPLYMSPEQAQINNLDVDTRSDVYSLGVLLYELLTGTTPLEMARFKEAAWDEIRRIIREEEPPRPSTRLSSTSTLPSLAACRQTEPVKLARQLRGDLDWIVMKALDKDRSRRYETANGVAADVRRYLANEPVVARPPSAAYRFQKAYRRNKAAFLSGAAVAVALMLGISVSLWQLARERRQREIAELARQKALIAEQEAWKNAEKANAAEARERGLHNRAVEQALAERKRAYASDMNLVRQELSQNNLARAHRLLNRHRPEQGEIDLRGWEWRYLWGQARRDDHEILVSGVPRIFRMQFSSDGRLLAYFTGRQIVVIDMVSRRKIFEQTAERGIALAHKSNLLAFTRMDSGQSKLQFFDLASNKESLPPKDMPGPAVFQKFTPDDRILITVLPNRDPQWRRDGNCLLTATEVSTGATLWQHPVNIYQGGLWVGRLDISPDGSAVALSVTAPPPARLANVVPPPATSENEAPPSAKSANEGGQVSVFDVRDGQKRFDFTSTKEAAMEVRFSPDSSLLLTSSGYGDADIRLWDARDGQVRGKLEGHRRYITGLEFTPDGKTLISSSGDYTIRIWDWSERRPVGMLRGHLDEVDGLTLSPDGKTLASRSKDGMILLWDLNRQTQHGGYQTFVSLASRLSPIGTRSHSFEFTADRRFLVEKPFGVRPMVWDLTTLQSAESPLKPWEKDHAFFAMSRDARHVVVAGRRVESAQPERIMKVLDVRSGQEIASLTDRVPQAFRDGLPFGSRGYAFSSSGKSFVTFWQGRIRTTDNSPTNSTRVFVDIWDTDAWQHRRLELPLVGGISVSGNLVLTPLAQPETFAFVASREVHVWDAATPDQVPRRIELPSGSGGPISGFAVSPDGASAAAVTEEGILSIWDWKTLELRRSTRAFLQGGHSVNFSPDSRRLVAGSDLDESVKLYDTDNWEELLTLAGEGSRVSWLKFSPDGKRLLGVNAAGVAHVWHAPTLQEIADAEAKGKTP